MRNRTFGHHYGPWMAPFPGHFAFDFEPRGRGGRGGRGRRRRNRGDVRAALLALLSERPMHGYEMIQELDERTGGIWRPSPGSVYPTLQLLEDEGLISGAGFDVTLGEPPPLDGPLMRAAGRPNVILTPHVAWASDEAQQALADQLMDNIENFVAGRPTNLVKGAF